MRNRRLIIANWKMNPLSIDEARRLAMSIEHRMHQFHNKADVAVCPPFLFLPALSQYLHFIKLGAQNCSWEETGPFTGEVSPGQLSQYRVEYVILGHSERRLNFGESDGAVMLKLFEAMKRKLTPVLCLGGEKNAKKEGMKRLVSKQFKDCLAGIDKKDWHKIVFVYEPVWAISTMSKGEPATGEHAVELISYIRSLIAKGVGKHAAATIKILYGGSVNRTNAAQFAHFEEIDGALVGAAGLEAENFTEVIREFARTGSN